MSWRINGYRHSKPSLERVYRSLGWLDLLVILVSTSACCVHCFSTQPNPAALCIANAVALCLCQQARRGMENVNKDLHSGLGEIAAVPTAGLMRSVWMFVPARKRLKRDLANVLATVRECHNDNMAYFRTFTDGIGAVHGGVETRQVRLRRNYWRCFVSRQRSV